jgi:negative regulator of sigma E activity
MENNYKIKENNILEDFIKSELSTEPNPFLVSKIMDRLEATTLESKRGKRSFALQSIAVAAGVTIAVVMGISLGTKYTETRINNKTLAINDSYIENLGIYTQQE